MRSNRKVDKFDKAMASARLLEAQVETKHSAELMFKRKVRARDHKNMLDRLGRVGAKLSTFSGYDTLMKKAERMYTLQQLLDDRERFLTVVRETPVKAAQRC